MHEDVDVWPQCLRNSTKAMTKDLVESGHRRLFELESPSHARYQPQPANDTRDMPKKVHRPSKSSASRNGGNVMERTPEGALINDIFLLIFRMNGRLTRVGDAVARDVGLTAARWQVLGAVAQVPKTVAQIAREFGLTRQGVLFVTQSMIGDEMVELIDNPNHRRAKLVKQTPKGKVAYDKVTRRQKEWVNRIGRSLDLAGLRAANRMLEKLNQSLAEQDSAADEE